MGSKRDGGYLLPTGQSYDSSSRLVYINYSGFTIPMIICFLPRVSWPPFGLADTFNLLRMPRKTMGHALCRMLPPKNDKFHFHLLFSCKRQESCPNPMIVRTIEAYLYAGNFVRTRPIASTSQSTTSFKKLRRISLPRPRRKLWARIHRPLSENWAFRSFWS
jgi:hypothetical protein